MGDVSKEFLVMSKVLYNNVITRGESFVMNTSKIVTQVSDAGLTSTAGTLGQFCWETSASKLYFCTVTGAAGAATWKEVTLS